MAKVENQTPILRLSRREFLKLAVPTAAAVTLAVATGTRLDLSAAPGGTELSPEDLAQFERDQIFLGQAEALRALAQEEMNIRFKLVSFSYAEEAIPQPDRYTHVIEVEMSRAIEDLAYVSTAKANLRALEGIVSYGMHGTDNSLEEGWDVLRGYIRIDDSALSTTDVEAALGGIVSAPRIQQAEWYPLGREEFFESSEFTLTNPNTPTERSFLPVPLNNGPYVPPIYARQVPVVNEGFNLQPSQPQSTGITAPPVPGAITNEGVTMGAAKKLAGQVLTFLAGLGLTGGVIYGLSKAVGTGMNQQQSETK